MSGKVSQEIIDLMLGPQNVQQCDAIDAPSAERFEYNLGRSLGSRLVENGCVSTQRKACFLTTEDDAHFFSKGLYEVLTEQGISLHLVCMSNRPSWLHDAGVEIAPIIRRLEQPGYEGAVDLIAAQRHTGRLSVLKTNITAVLEKADPQRILVAMPFSAPGLNDQLLSEFPDKYAKRFSFECIAEGYWGDTPDILPVTPDVDSESSRPFPAWVLDILKAL